MKEKLFKNKTIIIIAAAVVLAAIGFAAGMMVKSALADSRGSYIDAEQAKTIALESVGVSQSKATFTKVQLDESDRPVVYDIEFYTSANEYDFEINAITSEIVEKSSEAIAAQPTESPVSEPAQPSSAAQSAPAAQQVQTQPQTSASAASGSDYIGTDKAKSIALNHAGLSKVAFTKSELDSDDGTRVYEIEFIAGNKEYEYKINAYTGKVIEHDIDRLDDDDEDDD